MLVEFDGEMIRNIEKKRFPIMNMEKMTICPRTLRSLTQKKTRFLLWRKTGVQEQK